MKYCVVAGSGIQNTAALYYLWGSSFLSDIFWRLGSLGFPLFHDVGRRFSEWTKVWRASPLELWFYALECLVIASACWSNCIWISAVPAEGNIGGPARAPFCRCLHSHLYFCNSLSVSFAADLQHSESHLYPRVIPCYAVLSAEGFDILTRGTLIRAVTYGIVTCWAVNVYLAYFVL